MYRRTYGDHSRHLLVNIARSSLLRRYGSHVEDTKKNMSYVRNRHGIGVNVINHLFLPIKVAIAREELL